MIQYIIHILICTISKGFIDMLTIHFSVRKVSVVTTVLKNNKRKHTYSEIYWFVSKQPQFKEEKSQSYKIKSVYVFVMIFCIFQIYVLQSTCLISFAVSYLLRILLPVGFLLCMHGFLFNTIMPFDFRLIFALFRPR